mmetsp:Transcript_75521/g.157526  ORF Transcript_75521/g.157526 Transcript_75521/m.157526 type:complete len:366 (-) Transcript_75521:223-1320(-)
MAVSLGFLSRTAGAEALMAVSPRMLGACTPRTPKTPSRSPLSGKSPFSAKSSPTFFTPDVADATTPSRACSKKRLLFPSSPQGNDISSPIATSFLLQKSIAVATATQMQLESVARPSAVGARQHFLERQARRARGGVKPSGTETAPSSEGPNGGFGSLQPGPFLPLKGNSQRPTLLGRRSGRSARVPASPAMTLETALSPGREADTPSSAFLSPPSRRHNRRTRFADEVDADQVGEAEEEVKGPTTGPAATTPDYDRMACGGLWAPVLAGAGGPLAAGPVLAAASEPQGHLTIDEGLRQQLPKTFPTMLGAEAASAAEETSGPQPKITITVSRPGQDMKLTVQSAAESARAAFLARRARLASRGA